MSEKYPDKRCPDCNTLIFKGWGLGEFKCHGYCRSRWIIEDFEHKDDDGGKLPDKRCEKHPHLLFKGWMLGEIYCRYCKSLHEYKDVDYNKVTRRRLRTR